MNLNLLLQLSSLLFVAPILTNSLPRQTRADCTLTGSSLDDLTSIVSSCTSITIKDLTVPAGETLDLTELQSGTTVTFEGDISFDYEEWEGPLIHVRGSNIIIIGASGNKINGNGPSYWDGRGASGGRTKPKFFRARLTDSIIRGINIYNSPVHVFSLNNCKNLTVQNVLIDDSAGDSGGGHNTNGFDVSESDHVSILDSNIHNQDDCLAINSGTDINFINNICRGGHGISVGSVGNRTNNVVDGVVVKNCQIIDNDNGIRIKTVYGATGSVNNVTYQDITLSNIIEYGITIRGDYNNEDADSATDGLPITDLTIKNVTGTVASSATRIFVLVKGASDWNWSDINITGGLSSNGCFGIPEGSGASC